jgi:ribosomal protein S18 acetylase RimI-like enzyme
MPSLQSPLSQSSGCEMTSQTDMSRRLTYYKRFQMQAELLAALPAVPPLPDGYTWTPWHDSLLEQHAEVKYHCFHGEIDGVVFPNLSCREGCLRLMREIHGKPGFLPGATWLLSFGAELCGTVQGVSDRRGGGSIQNLGIVPAHRGRGLGTGLLLQALHGFRRANLQRAILEVTAQNEGAIRLYRRFGFRFRKTLYKVLDACQHLQPVAEPDLWFL